MARIELDELTAQRIAELASSEGITQAEYLKRMFPAAIDRKKRSGAEFLREIETLSDDGPPLPVDFSRADLYDEHD